MSPLKIFRFIAQDRTGREHEGRIQAHDEDDAYNKLKSKGYYPKSLTEEGEAAEDFHVPVTKKTLRERLKSGEAITYGLPVIGVIIMIIATFFVVRYINPEPPEAKPEVIVQEYFEAERRGNFEDQYEMFSRGRQNYYESAKKYSNRRRGIGLDAIGLSSGDARQVKVEAIEILQMKQRLAQVGVRVLRPSGNSSMLFVLAINGGKWTIEFVREPTLIHEYLEKIRDQGGYDNSKDLVRELKLETGLSDLEIQKELKNLGRTSW